MKNITLSAVFAAGFALVGTAALAEGQPPAEIKPLVIDGINIVAEAQAPSHMDIPAVYSGWEFRASETQALQLDDFDNPGMLEVDAAREAFNTVDGAAGKSCASCHTGGPEEFKGLAAVLPRWNPDQNALYTMEDYINYCRTERMQADAWPWGKTQLNGMVGLLNLQSRGEIRNVAIDGPVADLWQQGHDIYYVKQGQLGMSCSSCHEENYGVRIRAEILSQGQTVGFPVYRLKNAHLNSVENRFKGCMKNMRAEPYKPGGAEFHALELYVASRSNGLGIEGPSVRN